MVSSEALYRGAGPRLKEVRTRSGLLDKPGLGAPLILWSPQPEASGEVRRAARREGVCFSRVRGGQVEEEVEQEEAEEEDDPLLRGFPDASSSSRRALPAPVRGSGEKGEGNGPVAAAARRQPGLQRGRAARGAERVRARETRACACAGVRARGPRPPPLPPAVSAPLALVCVELESAAGGGAWNLETDPAPPPPSPGMY